MSHLFDRIANLTKATLHEALNKLENPVMMTGQYLRNLEDDIYQANKQLTETRSAAKVLSRQLDDAKQQMAVYEQHALNAITAGDEVLARRSVEAKLHYESQVAKLSGQLDAAERRSAELELQLENAKEELERLKKKREELVARAQKVDERKSEYHPNFSRGFEPGEAARGFERMEEKISNWESSSSQFNGGFPSDQNRSLVEEELQRLQNQTKSSGDAGNDRP